MPNDDYGPTARHYLEQIHSLYAEKTRFAECWARWKYAKDVGFANDRNGRPTYVTIRWAESIGGHVRAYGSGLL